MVLIVLLLKLCRRSIHYLDVSRRSIKISMSSHPCVYARQALAVGFSPPRDTIAQRRAFCFFRESDILPYTSIS